MTTCRRMQIDPYLSPHKNSSGSKPLVNQGPQHKTGYTKSHRRESGKYPWMHWPRGQSPELVQNFKVLIVFISFKIYNQMTRKSLVKILFILWQDVI